MKLKVSIMSAQVDLTARNFPIVVWADLEHVSILDHIERWIVVRSQSEEPFGVYYFDKA